MQSLADRHTSRSISDQAVSDQELSNLLWATWGINRADGRHTAPTARNNQEVAVYVALSNGVWLYNPKENQLELKLDQDARYRLGGAPITLLYAAPSQDKYAPMHIGALFQNAGLYCASAGLANVVKGSGIDALNGMLELLPGYQVYIIHSIGYPK